MRALRRFECSLLHVLGKDDRRWPAPRERKPDRAVDHVRQLGGLRHLLHIFGDVGEHAVEVQLLLVAAPAHRRFGLPADREHRHVVELGVVKAGDKMGRAGAAGREAYAQLAGEFGIRDRHEGRHFLVARLDEVDVAVALERADDAVDAVAGIAEDPFDAPGLQSFDEEVRCLHGCARHFRECGDNAVADDAP